MKQLTIYQISYNRVGYEEADIKEEEYKEAIMNYDENGLPVREEHFNPDGSRNTLIVNQYNEDKKLSISNAYDAEDILEQQLTYFYDEQGHVVKKGVQYGEDSPVYYTHFLYENGLLLRQDSYDEDEFAYTEKTFEYQGEKLVKETEFTEDEDVLYLKEYCYNDKGLIIKHIRNEVLVKDRRTYIYEYDNADNKIKELILNYDGELIAKTYFTYTENNLLAVNEYEDLDKYKKICYQYEGEKYIKVEEFDKEENLIQWEEYTYDKDGNPCLIDTYHRDEVNPTTYRKVSTTKSIIE
ncbi:MAG: hypothetical protein LBV46_00585 [Bacteroidales bacterium]|jgi:SepF-like predicted cell division protein (DUF552 family)|nr:hypothetical protein [Bacteroidales bacterium]